MPHLDDLFRMAVRMTGDRTRAELLPQFSAETHQRSEIVNILPREGIVYDRCRGNALERFVDRPSALFVALDRAERQAQRERRVGVLVLTT